MVTSNELPALPRIEEGGEGEQQQVMLKHPLLQHFISEKSLANHPTQGAAEQPGEQGGQGVDAEQPGDGPQVEKFSSWGVYFDPSFSTSMDWILPSVFVASTLLR